MTRLKHMVLSMLFLSTINVAYSQACNNDGINNWLPLKGAIRIGFFPPSYLSDDTIGCYSAAFGQKSIAYGYASFSTGMSCTALGSYAVAMGAFTNARKLGTIALGNQSDASGYASVAIGNLVHAKSYGGIALGNFNDFSDAPNADNPAATDRIFQLGNGSSGNRSNALTILRNGKTGIGVTNPEKNLSIKGGLNIDQANQHIAGQMGDNMLTFGSNSGEGIGSGRSSAGSWGLNFYTNNLLRMVISNNGAVSIAGNLSINGKGIIRSSDGVQLKKLSTTVTVSNNPNNFAAGETKTFTITFPEPFSGVPEVYVGNITGGAGGWAEVVMSVASVTTTGAVLYVYNPRTVPTNADFTVKIIGIGAQ